MMSQYVRQATQSCYHHLFEAQVLYKPDKIALVFEGESQAYQQLNLRANQLAGYLREQGLGPEKLAGICMNRSGEMIIAILAVLKAGGAYVPLDPAYPQERLAFMVEDAQISLLLTETETKAALPDSQARIICLDTELPLFNSYTGDNLSTNSDPANLAYVIYTSGSTGRPKGVMITHQNLVQFVRIVPQALDVGPEDVYLQSASITYALSVRQIMVALGQGATLVVAGQKDIRDPLALFRLVKRQAITMMDVVPSFWRLSVQFLSSLDESELQVLLNNQLRQIVSIGEPLVNDLPKYWRKRFKHPARLVNIFGQTETTGIVSAYPIPDEPPTGVSIVSIGRPLPQTQIYILDEQMNPASPGMAGEILIDSECVTRGYLNRPGLTAEKMIPNPFADKPGMRLYRTGDLAQYNNGGIIEFLGRKDNQVQIRGMRVELGEVVRALHQHPAVEAAAVITRKNQLDDQQLVAYFVLSQPLSRPAVVLRRFLEEQLPAFMIPAVYVNLDSLPLTPNGKVDRRALPPPSLAQYSSPHLLSKEPDLSHWFYRPQWQPAPLPEPAVEILLENKATWLLFVNKISRPLATFLQEKGQKVIQVNAGECFAIHHDLTFTINPTQRQDYDALQAHLLKNGLKTSSIIQAWNVGPENKEKIGFHSLMALTQTFADHVQVNPLHLLVVSSNTQPASGSEVRFPERAMMLGACQVIPLEFPQVRTRMVDIDLPADTAELLPTTIASIVAEIAAPPGAPPAVYRAGRRWIQTFQPSPLPPVARQEVKLRHKGVYLITGGLGGIGLALAGYLAQGVKARLILTGRSAFPPRQAWANWLDTHSADDPTIQIINRLLELERFGGEVLVLQADVTKADEMRRVVGEILHRYGALHGVIHAAGVANPFCLLRDTDWESVEQELAPKVQGTRVLAEVVEGQSLDFILLFSSLSATLGRLGQIGYCAANAFLDAFAYYAAQKGLPVTAVNWDTWTEVGSAVSQSSWVADDRTQLDYLENGITTAEGLTAFERILGQSEPQIIVSTRDLLARLAQRQMVLRGQSAGRGPRPNLETPFIPPRSKLEREIAAVWADLLEIEAVGVYDDFFDLGGHSLLVVKVFAAVEAAYGYRLPLDVLFQTRTVAALTGYLQESEKPALESVLVPIRSSGERPPLFCVHGVGGHVLRFHSLAKSLPEVQPVFGLKSLGLNEEEAPLETIEGMAGHYLDAIRTVQPTGPYLLAGLSFGGFIAFEMACQLLEQDQQVALLALFDTDANQSPLYLPALSIPERFRYYGRRAMQPPIRLAAKMRGWLAGNRSPDYLQEFSKEPEGDDYQDDLGMDIPESETILRQIMNNNAAALHQYKLRPYPGELILFKSSRHGLGRYYGWSEIVKGGVKTYEIPGSHVGILEFPGVVELAGRLDECIVRMIG